MSADKDNLNTMMCLDIYLSSLNEEDYDKVAHAIKPRKILPLISWDFAGKALTIIDADTNSAEKLKLNELSVKYLWRLDVESLLNSPYDALVVTNLDRKICWANNGFTSMTGYPLSFAMGKNPNFLQGKNTSAETRKKISKHLKDRKPFTGTIVNYRKNKEQYLCEVKIIPISNFNDEITHFIALEREAV